MPKRFVRALVICILALLSAASAACSDLPGTPAASPSAAPSSIGMKGNFSIAFIESDGLYNSADVAACMGRMQRMLNDRGWKVRLQLKLVDFSAGESAAEDRLIRTEIAAGSACDGYIVSDEAAAMVSGAGLTQNAGDLVRREAPKLYARFKRYFDRGAAGLPAYVRTRTKYYPAALFLPGEIAGASGLSTLSDVFDWLARADPTLKIGAYAYPASVGLPSLMDIWAGERGYYPLSLYGMVGDFYAAYGDAACTPVPVESIDGFRAFADRCSSLITGGRILNSSGTLASYDPAASGYIGQLKANMDRQFLISRGRTGRDYAAYPLRGSSQPSLPREEADVYGVVVIPAGSVVAPLVARLLEWVSTDPDGYTLTSYGEQGVDYRMADGLLEPLCQGRPITIDDWNSSTSKAFSSIARPLFYEDDMTPPTVFSALNYTAAAVDAEYPPIWGVEALRGRPEKCTVFDDIEAQMQATIWNRSIFLAGLITDELDDDLREHCASQLQAIHENTDELARLYAGRIRELTDAQKGD